MNSNELAISGTMTFSPGDISLVVENANVAIGPCYESRHAIAKQRVKNNEKTLMSYIDDDKDL